MWNLTRCVVLWLIVNYKPTIVLPWWLGGVTKRNMYLFHITFEFEKQYVLFNFNASFFVIGWIFFYKLFNLIILSLKRACSIMSKFYLKVMDVHDVRVEDCLLFKHESALPMLNWNRKSCIFIPAVLVQHSTHLWRKQYKGYNDS